VAILVSIVIVVMVTAVNDLQKEKQFKDLQAQQSKSQLADVIRSGEHLRIVYEEVLVGDVVLVGPGLVLPADGVLISCNNIQTDESALTGESHDIRKSLDENPWLLSGTAVKQGSGTMIVTCVGLFSEEGIIQKLITGVGHEESARLEELALVDQSEAELMAQNVDRHQQENFDALPEEEQDKLVKEEAKKSKKKDSVLQAKLERMALQIGYGATFFAILTIVVLVIRFSVEHFAIDGAKYNAKVWGEYVEFLVVGITVLVVAIPEGLPLAVTISLAYSVKKMMKDHNLVRVLAACETMGNATTICSDKTGTLTKNRMTVVRSWVSGMFFKTSDKLQDRVSKDQLEILAQGIALNSDRGSRYSINPEDGLPVQENNKTECACLQYADGFASQTYAKCREGTPDTAYVKVYPFDSAKKRMQTIIPLGNGQFRMYVKGASEIVLAMCSSYIDADGKAVPVTPELAEQLTETVIVDFASQALRVICLAYKDFDGEQNWDDEDALLQDLVISSFVGIQDPVRDEVPDAVLQCQEAGVTVRMVTGDNVITARAIAINCNIIKPDDDFLVMEGPDFRRRVVKPDGSLDYEELNKIAPRLRVMARCSPADKYNLVKGLIKAGDVVAVTGDGTNDGPALSEADVGFAMGIAGTGVAREASDIIITDDNFSSIVKAISWGRNVYDSISKFLVFQLTVNVVAVLVAFIGACAIKESPLRAVQLLWVNLIMDTFAALALATEAPTPDLLKRKPYGRSQPLLSRIMIRQIIGHSLYQLTIILLLVFYGEKIFDIPSGRKDDIPETADEDEPTQHLTIVFNSFVWMQIFNEINARVIHDDLTCPDMGCWLPGPIQALLRPFRGFFRNPIFISVILGTAVAQAIITEFGGKAISTTGLTGSQWGACIGFGAFSLVWNMIIHYIFPVRWIPAYFEGGAYADLTPDRMHEDDEDEEKKPKDGAALPAGGVDAQREGVRSVARGEDGAEGKMKRGARSESVGERASF
jgi:Ca2+ transporting ATPase